VNTLAMTDSPEEILPQLASVIFGRFMMPDQSEHPCQVTDITHEGAAFVSSLQPPAGIAIVAYIEEIGRVECLTTGLLPNGFEVRYTAEGARLERLKSKIDFMSKKTSGGPDSRKHTRYEPAERRSQITLPDGRVYNCEVVDISLSGAAIKTDVLPSLGTYLMLGRMKGRVVRYIESGVGIEFQKQIESQNLQQVIHGDGYD
jgi:PilZ domain